MGMSGRSLVILPCLLMISVATYGPFSTTQVWKPMCSVVIGPYWRSEASCRSDGQFVIPAEGKKPGLTNGPHNPASRALVNWNMFPKIGSPGGPGGSLLRMLANRLSILPGRKYSYESQSSPKAVKTTNVSMLSWVMVMYGTTWTCHSSGRWRAVCFLYYSLGEIRT